MGSKHYEALDLATSLASLPIRAGYWPTNKPKASRLTSTTITRRPVRSLPPELLFMIVSEFIASYLDELFFTPFQKMSDWKTSTPNHIPALLRVSRQFREVTFKVLHEVLAIEREPDGTLQRDAWKGIHHVRRIYHRIRDGDRSFSSHSRQQALAYELPPFLHIRRALALYKWDVMFHPHFHASPSDYLLTLPDTMVKFAVEVAEIKSEPFQQRLVDELLHTFATCDCILRFLQGRRVCYNMLSYKEISINPIMALDSEASTEYPEELLGEELWENLLDVASMLHRTFLRDDIIMPIDESLLHRFGHIINERLFTCTKTFDSIWRLMQIEVFAEDLLVGALMRSILDKWLPIAFPQREVMLARKAKQPQMPRRWSFSS